MGVSAGDSTLGVVFAAAQRSRPVVPRHGGETDEYMIFGRIGATELFIWALGECNWGSSQMFSSRWVMSQFASFLRSVIYFFGHDSEIIQEWICDVSASTLLQAIVPRVLSREIT
ncbi:hypothetical protein F2Q70_00019871 [Brassica cretica]|uniref:Uncharacterized protein n=1 Tax=Brassica cretica TaxID=69181 RepID=A0A8S9GLW2_BRACR|nr:hypothetical protein F2Q70_00019871 [Brassica cretica]